MSSSERFDEFDRLGFTVVDGLLSAQEVEVATHAIETAKTRLPDTNSLSLSSMVFASNLFYESLELQQLLCSRSVLDIVCPLFGPDLWVRWDQAVWKGPGAPEFPWHQDNGYTELGCEHLQLWIALTPSDFDNGGLIVAPGRHREQLPHRLVGAHVVLDEPVETVETVEITAKPGDAVVFSSLTPHFTTKNTTSATRLAYVAEFLPLHEPDHSISTPHFVASISGQSVGEFDDLTPRWRRRGRKGSVSGSPLQA